MANDGKYFSEARRKQREQNSFDSPRARAITNDAAREGFGAGKVRLDLASMRSKLEQGGIHATSLVADAEYRSKYSHSASERRAAALELKAIEKLQGGVYDKRFIETYPELSVASDGDAYGPSGEYAKEIDDFRDVPASPPPDTTMQDHREADTNAGIEALKAEYRERAKQEADRERSSLRSAHRP